ncbi:CLCA_X family protein [Pseudoalteromonas peptidolytica]|uniref:Large polyvalent protein-associated domain-containing protein n=1 Tax=Pseudoalteromonas peptidolytica F12-50-A1 TaxID=1315280 RepID=A0A8I0MVP8_9GAMM|nr:CLCA_X family protein [Pseudoalteromonas peptidolytica]MBE0346211.1 hypothetical protein [Pseudoalteromonas peptidolytica F12-50-A1]NLR14128.1 hypothetical protein [Pseudoalteromonas peptidolytica]GEK10664.1 hypothetical protein PPE03_29130 [Pseudoalteromonas peptidolytica]
MNQITKRSRLHQGYGRNGPDYRFGDQVDFSEIKLTFGFKTMTIGSWVTPEESRLSANLIYDSLADLAQILGVPPTVIGLRGTLNFAFGTGGRPGVQAHYAPTARTLALAKNAGGGALAHEWWHAFDHYICQHLIKQPTQAFASSAWLLSTNTIAHPLNNILSDFYAAVLLTENKAQPNEYFHVAKLADKANKQVYYALPEELTARMFEAVIAYHDDIENLFLAGGIKGSEQEKLGIYPLQRHRTHCAKIIHRYFSELGTILYQKQS